MIDKEIEYKAKLEKEREERWLRLIKLDKGLYDLYLKYPTALELIREMQETINDIRRNNNIKSLQWKPTYSTWKGFDGSVE